jgi:hypothetical protein
MLGAFERYRAGNALLGLIVVQSAYLALTDPGCRIAAIGSKCMVLADGVSSLLGIQQECVTTRVCVCVCGRWTGTCLCAIVDCALRKVCLGCVLC